MVGGATRIRGRPVLPAAAWGAGLLDFVQGRRSVDSAELLNELEVAKPLGFESIIVDDGWQTLDTNRGLRLCGGLEAGTHDRHEGGSSTEVRSWGVKVVPLVRGAIRGQERRRWRDTVQGQIAALHADRPRGVHARPALSGGAGIADRHLSRQALRDWKLDGSSLISSIASSPTSRRCWRKDGRDYASVNEGADRLMTDVIAELKKINPDVMLGIPPAVHRSAHPQIREYVPRQRQSECLSRPTE